MSILQQILAEKEEKIKQLKAESILPLKREPLSLKQAIQKQHPLGVIAEIKRQSPSKGELKKDIDPAARAILYEKSGAAAISVLTDEPFFKGSYGDLEAVRKAVGIPILCKDFIIDPIQLRKAQSAGADAVLLIVAALEERQLQYLYKEATALGLEVLVEVHDKRELEAALELGAELIGINNRNLSTFEVTLDTTAELIPLGKKDNTLFISESGIHTRLDAEKALLSGAGGILVGEALMCADNIEAAMAELTRPVRREGR